MTVIIPMGFYVFDPVLLLIAVADIVILTPGATFIAYHRALREKFAHEIIYGARSAFLEIHQN